MAKLLFTEQDNIFSTCCMHLLFYPAFLRLSLARSLISLYFCFYNIIFTCRKCMSELLENFEFWYLLRVHIFQILLQVLDWHRNITLLLLEASVEIFLNRFNRLLHLIVIFAQIAFYPPHYTIYDFSLHTLLQESFSFSLLFRELFWGLSCQIFGAFLSGGDTHLSCKDRVVHHELIIQPQDERVCIDFAQSVVRLTVHDLFHRILYDFDWLLLHCIILACVLD